ncbi:MAG: tRNA (adenosine(37)-N6)-threonylcarbamoyltransferase complex ATPase subunit type 1 TsaE [Candidatus Marinamargulisbacteria bacterium]|jgi:tRNA threonylcarbamoyladenosine biosynthesis protein TsaE|nr:tRNA (adenosine(37)-N6)-threonylcarbamoyltransferase complex ATPase subunit type 1 TsaE [Candidatus Marinamargulisbacteria bacterium]
MNQTFSYSELPAICVELMPAVMAHRLVLFSGPMGAGKTTVIAALAHALGCTDWVRSPSYTWVNQYRIHSPQYTGPLYHLDLYRLDTVSSVESVVHHVDLARYIEDADALCFIEWGEQLPPVLHTRPPLCIHMDYGQSEDERVVWTTNGTSRHPSMHA